VKFRSLSLVRQYSAHLAEVCCISANLSLKTGADYGTVQEDQSQGTLAKWKRAVGAPRGTTKGGTVGRTAVPYEIA